MDKKTKEDIQKIYYIFDQINSDLRIINRRLFLLEKNLGIKKERKSITRRFFDVMVTYWHIVAFIAAIVGYILNYRFGFQIKGDL